MTRTQNLSERGVNELEEIKDLGKQYIFSFL